MRLGIPEYCRLAFPLISKAIAMIDFALAHEDMAAANRAKTVSAETRMQSQLSQWRAEGNIHG
jgi:hypothetical protein